MCCAWVFGGEAFGASCVFLRARLVLGASFYASACSPVIACTLVGDLGSRPFFVLLCFGPVRVRVCVCVFVSVCGACFRVFGIFLESSSSRPCLVASRLLLSPKGLLRLRWSTRHPAVWLALSPPERFYRVQIPTKVGRPEGWSSRVLS